MKKILSLILSAIMISSLFVTTSYASDFTWSWDLTSKEIEKTDKVTLKLSSKQVIAAWDKVLVDFDEEYFEIDSMVDADGVSAWNEDGSINYDAYIYLEAYRTTTSDKIDGKVYPDYATKKEIAALSNNCIAFAVYPAKNTKYAANDDFVTITFKVKEDANLAKQPKAFELRECILTVETGQDPVGEEVSVATAAITIKDTGATTPVVGEVVTSSTTNKDSGRKWTVTAAAADIRNNLVKATVTRKAGDDVDVDAPQTITFDDSVSFGDGNCEFDLYIFMTTESVFGDTFTLSVEKGTVKAN